jgi:hypothetical protein
MLGALAQVLDADHLGGAVDGRHLVFGPHIDVEPIAEQLA